MATPAINEQVNISIKSLNRPFGNETNECLEQSDTHGNDRIWIKFIEFFSNDKK